MGDEISRRIGRDLRAWADRCVGDLLRLIASYGFDIDMESWAERQFGRLTGRIIAKLQPPRAPRRVWRSLFGGR